MGSFKSIVVLTGAGISAESGLRTFRASDGLWEDHRIEDVATPEGFARNPQLVHRFYNMRRQQLLDPKTQPNRAHQALARLEAQFEGEFVLVTQNVDNLHEQAGSSRLIHMHGELMKARCRQSLQVSLVSEDITPETRCSCCGQPGNLRPDIVWFGEVPMAMDSIYDALESCDLFISIGTSGTVYPANGFVQLAQSVGAHTVELNLEPSRQESIFSEQVYGRASEIVPRYVQQLLAGQG